MLRFESITKVYPHKRSPVTGLDNVSLTVKSGEFVAVVGPSGSGKTTFLVTAGAMLHPTEGKVYLNDRDVFSLSLTEVSKLRLNTIGFLFQTFNLIPYLTAQQNVMASIMLAGKKKDAQAKRAVELLERVGLGDRMDHKPNELSVGQQQRVALARMLANDPPLILADEPTGNLDPETAEEVLSFLHKLCDEENKTVIMVTHNPEAAKSCPRILHCIDGKITE